MSFNVPALWRFTKFYSIPYPITQVAGVHGQKPVTFDLKKYLTGDADSVARIIVRVFGNIVKAGAGPGVATGGDNPGNLLVSANLSSAPVFGNCIPFNSVSSRALHLDGIVNAGVITEDDPQAWGGSTPLTDAAATSAVDLYTVLEFKRTPGIVRQPIEYALPLGKYTSLTLQAVFGGRDQFFTGGTNTWDLSGLNVEFYADLDSGANPKYIHAHEMFENTYPVLASSKNFRIDNLPAGFVYSQLAIVTEDAGVPVDGMLNNVALFNGGQSWLNKGEGNAAALRYSFLQRNNRIISTRINRASIPGLYVLPCRDRMFTRAFDARFSQLNLELDVTSLSVNSVVRVVGRRMLPGGIFSTTPAAGK